MRVTVSGAKGKSFEIDDEQLDDYRRALAAVDDSPPVRLAYAAAHVVLQDQYAFADSSAPAASGAEAGAAGGGTAEEIAAGIDWNATLALRRHLAEQGFGIAEAMDTAQRFSIGWPAARRLIQECGRLSLDRGFIAGASVDHLERVETRDALVEGVLYQANLIQRAGGMAMILPMPWLSLNECDEGEYVEVYRAIVERLDGPVFVHWLGERFLPELKGYFPGGSFARVMSLDPEKVRGAKLSLLDANFEVRIRAELLKRRQIVLTGDDFHFTFLIRGGDPWSRDEAVPPPVATTSLDGQEVPLGSFSHALLGILDAIAVPAGLALRFLAHGDVRHYLDLMLPCEKLSRWVFRHPTRHYKADLAFLSWLNGLQSNPCLVGHEERARGRQDYLRTAELAAQAGVLRDAELAAERLEELGTTI